MSVKIKQIAALMDFWAPEATAEDFDNVGLLVGDGERATDRILTALDAVPSVIEEAINKKCGLIVTHHPLFRNGLKKINSESLEGKKIIRLLENKVALYAAHTNLDKADGGVNDVLCETLGLKYTTIKDEAGQNSFLRSAELDAPETLGSLAASFTEMLPEKVRPRNIKVVGDLDRKIRSIAVCCGNGMSLLNNVAKLGVDLFISGDIRYHDENAALEYGFAMLDLTHYGTEALIADRIKTYLEKKRDENGLSFEVFVSGQE